MVRRSCSALLVAVVVVMAGGCQAAPAGVSRTPSPDPVVEAALKSTHGTAGRIVGYVVDWLPGKAGLELIVMKDGSLRYPGGKPDYFWIGPHPPKRPQPESASEAVARERVVAAAHLAVTRNNRMMAASTPQVYEYGGEVILSNGATQTVALEAAGKPWRVMPLDLAHMEAWPLPLPAAP